MQPSDAPFILSRRDKIIAVTIGAVFGFVVGLTSVGSGTFFGLVMVLVYPLTMSKIVGTDIFHAAALLWVAGIGHLIGGNVDLHATAWLLVGSIPGVLITSRFTVRTPDILLRISLGTILLLSGLKLLNVPAGAVDPGRRPDRARCRPDRLRPSRVARAPARGHARHRVTPLDPFRDGIWLKREDEHQLGAFKWRGALATIEARRPEVVVTASTGNHGAATAWAATARRDPRGRLRARERK